VNWLPKHECGLHLSHNEHLDMYETIEDFYDAQNFISEDEWNKSIAENSVWSLQWYPKTPIGFHVICAASLEAIKQHLEENLYD
jgi:hypothetical protein